MDSPPSQQSNLKGSRVPGVDERDFRNAFRAIDLDKDGQISARDLRTFLEATGENPSDAEINEMIRLADKNMDGSIHLSEFLDLFSSFTSDGYPNEVFQRTVNILSSMRVDARQDTESDGEVVRKFIAQLPGSEPGTSLVSRDFVREVIERWRVVNAPSVGYKDFCSLLRARPNDICEKAFEIINEYSESDKIDIRRLFLVLGVFVSAASEERVDFASRLLDDTNSGMLGEGHIKMIVETNSVGLKTDTRSKVQRIMMQSDANYLVNRKLLTWIARTEPLLLFPPERIDHSIKH